MGVAAALATLVIRRAVCVAGISLIQTCARLALVCLSTSLPLSLLSSTNLSPLSLLHLVSPLCNFPLQLVIASYIAYYPRTKRSFHFQLPSLTPFPPPSGNTFPAMPDMSEADDDVLLGCAISFQLQLHHIAFLLRLLCHLQRRLFLPPVPPCPLSSFSLSLCPLCCCCLALSLPSALCFVSRCFFGFNFSSGYIL